MSDPLSQLSPRLSASYNINDWLSLNASTGRYYQLPPYTSLGYSDRAGNFPNKAGRLKYLGADHYVAGIEVVPMENMQLTVEGFYKRYFDYPFSVMDSVPLSSKSADYGIFGDEELTSSSSGRAMGFEVLARLKEFKRTNMVLSYTFVRSEFRTNGSVWIPSSWDNKHLVNLTATTRFNRNWDLGIKWRFVGGAPYSPYDFEKSSHKAAWDLQGRAYIDYSRFNTLRLKAFHQLDVRVDKQYFFSGWSLMLYADVQNVYNFRADQPPVLVRETDANKVPLSDPGDPSRYKLKYIETEAATILPTVGIIVEF